MYREQDEGQRDGSNATWSRSKSTGSRRKAKGTGAMLQVVGTKQREREKCFREQEQSQEDGNNATWSRSWANDTVAMLQKLQVLTLVF